MNIFKNKKMIIIAVIIVVVLLGLGFIIFGNKSNGTTYKVGKSKDLQVIITNNKINTKVKAKKEYTEGIMSSVSATNKGKEDKGVKLYYHINTISDKLINNDFKYVIVKSADNGEHYSIYSSGTFAYASSDADLEILTNENISANGKTYLYKVYVWLDKTSENKTKELFNGELKAEIVEK